MRRRFPWIPFLILAALLVFSSCGGADVACADGRSEGETVTAADVSSGAARTQGTRDAFALLGTGYDGSVRSRTSASTRRADRP